MDHLLKILGSLLMLQTVNAQGCADGYISFGGVQGCFKTFTEKVSWFEANETCEAKQLRMVKPSSNDDAINLRKALLDTFGHGTFWLAAMANGIQYVWVYDDTPLSNNDPLWFPELPGKYISNKYCLTISVNETNWNDHPNKPYGIGPCSSPWYATICEAVCPGGCDHGECTSPNSCTCLDGFTGLSCEKPVCPDGCGNGECTKPNHCTCNYGWTGNTCDTPVCSDACCHGECTKPNSCTCLAGYTGHICDTPVCDGGCDNGVCTNPNQCTCEYGWTGNTCDTPVCPYGCGNGECTKPNQCTCECGWTGHTCDTPVCEMGCIHGQCRKPNVCTCFNGYTGGDCNTCIHTSSLTPTLPPLTISAPVLQIWSTSTISPTLQIWSTTLLPGQ